MRRDRFVATTGSALWGVVITVLAVAVGTPALGAPASPSSAATTAEPVPGQPVCSIHRAGLTGISGIVARSTGYVVINDSQLDNTNAKIFFFDTACKYKTETSYPGSGAYDVEDLALAKDGTLWMADVGDNPPSSGGSGNRRQTIALWTLGSATADRPVIHRFKYPDGHHDAEALLLNGDNTPIIVTKENEKIGSPAGVYVPAEPMKTNNSAADAVPLRRAGEIKLPTTTTPNPLSVPGRQLVTGGAVSPDGKRVVLRTYADAIEWDVPDGDVVKAITTGKPRTLTPLPNEAQGEAITYSADGASFLTVSDLEGETPGGSPILKYAPVAAASVLPDNTKESTTGGDTPWTPTMQDLMLAVAGVGVLGFLLVVIGVLGIRRSRRARRAAASATKAKATMPVAPLLELEASSSEISGSGYGGPAAAGVAAAAERGAGDGGRQPQPQQGGGVYGRPAGGGGSGGAAGRQPQQGGGVYGRSAPGGSGARQPQQGGVYGAGAPPRFDGSEPGSGEISRRRGTEYPSGEVSRRQVPEPGSGEISRRREAEYPSGEVSRREVSRRRGSEHSPEENPRRRGSGTGRAGGWR